jgi:regulator of sigma E protease
VGITCAQVVEIRKTPVWQVPLIGITEAGVLMRLTVVKFWHAVFGRKQPKTLGGPIGMAQIAIGKADSDSRFMLFYAATLAVNIALLTMLPLPIFDGGQFIYLIIESIRGKQISSRIRRRLRLISIIVLTVFAVLWIMIDLVDILVG